MIRVGLIGCGAWGRNFFGAVRRTGIARVTHVVRVSAAVRDSIDLACVREVGRAEDLLPEVDAVVVATPPGSHLEICDAALTAGKPVMVEKPACLSLAQTLHLSRRTWDTRTPMLVNHVHLFSSAFERLRQEWSSRRGPFVVSSDGRGPGPFRDYDPLWDYGPHDVAMLSSLGVMGLRFTSAVRMGDGPARNYEVRFESGGPPRSRGSATLMFGNSSPAKIRVFSVEKDGFRAVYDDRSSNKLVLDGNPVTGLDPSPPLDRAVSSFVGVCAGRDPDWRFGSAIPVAVASTLDLVQRDVGP